VSRRFVRGRSPGTGNPPSRPRRIPGSVFAVDQHGESTKAPRHRRDRRAERPRHPGPRGRTWRRRSGPPRRAGLLVRAARGRGHALAGENGSAREHAGEDTERGCTHTTRGGRGSRRGRGFFFFPPPPPPPSCANTKDARSRSVTVLKEVLVEEKQTTTGTGIKRRGERHGEEGNTGRHSSWLPATGRRVKQA